MCLILSFLLPMMTFALILKESDDSLFTNLPTLQTIITSPLFSPFAMRHPPPIPVPPPPIPSSSPASITNNPLIGSDSLSMGHQVTFSFIPTTTLTPVCFSSIAESNKLERWIFWSECKILKGHRSNIERMSLFVGCACSNYNSIHSLGCSCACANYNSIHS